MLYLSKSKYCGLWQCPKIAWLRKFKPDQLKIPFQSGYYYNKAMGGSFSIKSVLPALFPDDPALD